jgi:hypothetical protein
MADVLRKIGLALEHGSVHLDLHNQGSPRAGMAWPVFERAPARRSPVPFTGPIGTSMERI